MPLLNYSTKIPAERTLKEILGILAQHQATDILPRYAGRPDGTVHPVAIAFRMATPFGPQEYALPANVPGVYNALKAQQKSGEIRPSDATEAQAERVAWRILKDWLEAQVAIIDAQMATMPEVMLPYMLVEGRQPLYRALESKQLALPPAEGKR